jgi:nicotinamidase-related amidase
VLRSELTAIGDTFESNPGLAERLKREGITSIVALGIQSECCVLSTCKGALAAGFEVTLLHGAHSTYDSDAKTALEIEGEAEAELERAGAKIVPWQDVIVD